MKRLNLSDQVVELLKGRIESGTYNLDSVLPSITELATELGVGRTTVREALKQLEIMEMISIRHGKGVFVTKPKVDFSSHLMSFSESISQLGLRPGAVVLKKAVEQAGAAIAEKLAIPAGTCVNHIVRLRLADDLPMAIEDSYTSCKLFPNLIGREDLDGSLYDILTQIYQCEIVYATRTIEAVFTRPEENKLFGLRGRHPGLLIETIALDRDYCPVEYGKSLYRADRYKFVVQQMRS